jgi:glycosyltransferase involved in cell wall biosynthesis
MTRDGAVKILDYHGVTPPSLWRGPGHRRLVAAVEGLRLAGRADLAIAHSGFLKDELVREAGLRPERVHVLPVPVALERFRGAAARPAGSSASSAAASRSPRPLTLLYVGRMAPHKRLDLLVEALGHVRASGVDARLWLAGGAGSWALRLCLRRARALASALGLAADVRYLGAVDDEGLPGLYAECDLFVTASEHEGFCVPAVEAMAAGRPVVAAASAAVPETVGDAGLLVPPGDARAMAEAIVRLARDEALGAALVERGLDRARAFSEDAYQTKLAEMLRGYGLGIDPSSSSSPPSGSRPA